MQIQHTARCSGCGNQTIPIANEFDLDNEEYNGIRSMLPDSPSIFGSNWRCDACNYDNRHMLNSLYTNIEHALQESENLEENTVTAIFNEEVAKYNVAIFKRTIASKPDAGSQRIITPQQHKRYKTVGHRGAECKTCHNITLLEEGPLYKQICQSCGEPLRLTTEDIIAL